MKRSNVRLIVQTRNKKGGNKMAVKEILIARKGNVVFKKNIALGMSGKGIRASKPRGGGSKVTYWVYVLPNMYPMKGFRTKALAEKFYRKLTK